MDVTNARIIRAVVILMFVGFLVSQIVLVSVGTSNNNYLQKLVCASGIGPNCPPPDAQTIQIQKQLAEQAKHRDDTLLAKIEKLLDRPSTTRVVTVEGPTKTRTIVVTRTRTICRTPSGKAC